MKYISIIHIDETIIYKSAIKSEVISTVLKEKGRYKISI